VVHDLDALVTGWGAAEAARAMGPGRSFGLVVGDHPGVTLRTADGGVVLDPGVEGAEVVVALDAAAFADLRAERMSIFGLLYAGLLTVERGEFDRVAAWEPALQALLYDRPVYDRDTADVVALGDATCSYALGDDLREMAATLERVGFLHVRDVFDPAEVAALTDEVERLRGLASPEDRRSWWATAADGEQVCCRLTFMNERSGAMAALADDPRLARLASLADPELRPAPTRNDGISAVLKHPAGTSGLSDLPWHRDCGLGGHPLLCPGVNIGVQLDRASAETGQLLFLPGSHRHAGPVGDPEVGGHATVAIDAEPGDVTVHFGHVLHAAPPPTGPAGARRTVYVGFSRPELFAQIPEGHAYNDVIYADGDGRVRNVAEQSSA